VCEKLAEHVRRAGASQRCQLLVKALHASELANFYGFQSDDEQTQADRRKSLAMFEEVAAQTDRPQEKAAYLFTASRVAELLSGPDALPTYRKILTKIMTDHPQHGLRDIARLKLLQTYIDNEGLIKANDQVRAWDKAGEPDLDAELYTIARARLDRKEFEIAQALCEEIIARFPDGAATGAAWVMLANMHEKAGREEKMIAAYKQAATAKPRDTHYDLSDAGNSQSEAHEFLGEYYMKREDWK
jgi:tetratricopeptide (TPR) repeat protein